MDDVINAVLTALGQSVATDAWTSFKKVLSKILGHGYQDESERAEQELQRDHDKLIKAHDAADDKRVTQIDAKWSDRLSDFLEDNPDCLEALRELANDYSNPEDTSGQGNIFQRNTSMDTSTIIAPAHGNVNIGHWPNT